MFKKLKAKIEEGGEGGIDNVSFSERRLPGSAVRTTSDQPTTPRPLRASPPPHSLVTSSRSPSPLLSADEDVDDEGVAVPSIEYERNVSINSATEVLPTHITSKPTSKYEALLEARIKQLEEEVTSLRDESSERELEHHQEVERLRGQVEKLDDERTELKLQVVELQLEKGDCESQLSERDREWAGLERQMNEKMEAAKKELEDRLHSLEETITEKNQELLDRGSALGELESKNTHLLSRLSAFEESSESEVAKRLRSEVADMEKTLRSRNFDIQILERRLAHQAKGNQEEVGAVVDKQFSLESTNKDVSGQLEQRKQENRELMRKLESERGTVGERTRELEQLQSQLSLQENKHKLLVEKLEEMRSNHERQVLVNDQLLQEKEERITELLTNLKQLRGDIGSAQLPDGSIVASVGGLRPPGLARRTATIGVQTSDELLIDNSEPAILQVDESVGVVRPLLTNGERATMMSLGPNEELTLLREDQLRLEDEVAGKNKIIKLQQQKILDMKKTLTKELQRTQSIPEMAGRSDHSPSPPPPRVAADVNFQYLKYVVLKFISSREDESSQLVRALSTLLEFSPQEEKYVKDYLEYKMSWFGSLPPPLTPSLVNK